MSSPPSPPSHPNAPALPKFTVGEPMRLQLLGIDFYGRPFSEAEEWSPENEIGKLWQRFGTLAGKYSFLLEKISSSPRVAYEVHFEPEDYISNKNLGIFVGIAVEFLADIPLDMVIKPLPAVSYLEFTTSVLDRSTAEYFFLNWLGTPQATYRQAYPYVVQRYDERFKGVDDPESEIDWLIPVVPK